MLANLARRFSERLHSGWYIKGDSASENRRRLVRFNITSALIANLIGGNFFTGLLLILKADDAFIGLVSIIVFSCNLLQLLTPYILEKLKSRKPLLIGLRIAIHSVNIILIGLIPFMQGDIKLRLMLMAVFQILINGLNAFSSPAMTVWHIAHVPNDVRVAYFSTVSLLNGSFVALFNLGAARLADLFKSSGLELFGLSTLRVLALLIAVYDIYLLSKIDELPLKSSSQKISLRLLITKPWKKTIFLRTVLISVLFNTINNLQGSYYGVYLLKELKLSYSYINLIAMLNIFVLGLATPFWKRKYTKYSWLAPLSCALALHSVHFFLLGFVGERRIFLYPIAMLLAFFFNAGIGLGMSGLAYINLPEENQSLYLGFYTTLANIGALIAASISRHMITSYQGFKLQIFGATLGEKQLLMLIVGTLIFLFSMVVFSVYRRNKKEGYEC